METYGGKWCALEGGASLIRLCIDDGEGGVGDYVACVVAD